MIFSISSFSKFTIATVLIIAALGLAMLAATEWLVRTRVLPADRLSWQLERFSGTQVSNIILGDSHAATGIHGLADFQNFAMPSDNMQVISAKADGIMRASFIPAGSKEIVIRLVGQGGSQIAIVLAGWAGTIGCIILLYGKDKRRRKETPKPVA